MTTDPSSTLRTYASRAEYRAAVNACAPATADDSTVLLDGTRIDTPAKARAYMAELRKLLADVDDS